MRLNIAGIWIEMRRWPTGQIAQLHNSDVRTQAAETPLPGIDVCTAVCVREVQRQFLWRPGLVPQDDKGSDDVTLLVDVLGEELSNSMRRALEVLEAKACHMRRAMKAAGR